MSWYKFTKTFRGGKGTYIEWIDEEELRTDKEGTLREHCRAIGENTSGGYENGWHVTCDEYVPTTDEINSLIQEAEREIRCYESNIWDLRNKLLLYYREMEKLSGEKNEQKD